MCIRDRQGDDGLLGDLRRRAHRQTAQSVPLGQHGHQLVAVQRHAPAVRLGGQGHEGQIHACLLYTSAGGVEALLNAARPLPHQRLICAFQPHTYTRTAALFDDFVRVLRMPDKVVLAEIYAAREKNELGISSRDLAAQIPGAVYCSTLEQVTEELARLAQPCLLYTSIPRR